MAEGKDTWRLVAGPQTRPGGAGFRHNDPNDGGSLMRPETRRFVEYKRAHPERVKAIRERVLADLRAHFAAREARR